MSLVISFPLKIVELQTVNIIGKFLNPSKELWNALEYGKITTSTDVVKRLCSSENYANNCQLIEFLSETNLTGWPKDSRNGKYYTT